MLNWGQDAPLVYGGLDQVDNFSIRWSGQFCFAFGGERAPGMYEFTVSSDDGSRLLIDGAKFADQNGFEAARL